MQFLIISSEFYLHSIRLGTPPSYNLFLHQLACIKTFVFCIPNLNQTLFRLLPADFSSLYSFFYLPDSRLFTRLYSEFHPPICRVSPAYIQSFTRLYIQSFTRLYSDFYYNCSEASGVYIWAAWLTAGKWSWHRKHPPPSPRGGLIFNRDRFSS